MKKQVFKIDDSGFFVEPLIQDNITHDCVEQKPPNGFYKPKWTGTNWVEGMAQEEIDELRKRPNLPSREERLRALEEAMIFLTLQGGM